MKLILANWMLQNSLLSGTCFQMCIVIIYTGILYHLLKHTRQSILHKHFIAKPLLVSAASNSSFFFCFLQCFQFWVATWWLLNAFTITLQFVNIDFILLMLNTAFVRRFCPWAKQPNIIKWRDCAFNICNAVFILFTFSITRALPWRHLHFQSLYLLHWLYIYLSDERIWYQLLTSVSVICLTSPLSKNCLNSPILFYLKENVINANLIVIYMMADLISTFPSSTDFSLWEKVYHLQIQLKPMSHLLFLGLLLAFFSQSCGAGGSAWLFWIATSCGLQIRCHGSYFSSPQTGSSICSSSSSFLAYFLFYVIKFLQQKGQSNIYFSPRTSKRWLSRCSWITVSIGYAGWRRGSPWTSGWL